MKEYRKTLRLPITNVHSKGGFSVSVVFNQKNNIAQLLLDTGSATLVVNERVFSDFSNLAIMPTSYAQTVKYGMGGWYGPMVKGEVSFISDDGCMVLEDTCFSVAKATQQSAFSEIDGIIGLAYHELNRGYNLTEYFTKEKISPAVTYPWNQAHYPADSFSEMRQFLKKQPVETIKPYFTQLEERDISANKFSFVTRRSSIHHHSPNLSKKALAEDPLNQGLFILGGGEEDTDLYQGEFVRVKVIDDVYYNVRLLKVKVPGFDAFNVPKLKGRNQVRHHSNAFIDTGATLLVLDDVVFNYLIDCFEKIRPEFKTLLEPFLSFEGVEEGIPMKQLDLAAWPDIEFIFEASDDCETDEVSLICKADDYWQVNAPKYGEASFKILSQLPGWPDQSILGLPLISDYYVIFARFENEHGDIKFAKANT